MKIKEAFGEEFDRQLNEEMEFQVSMEEAIRKTATITKTTLTKDDCPNRRRDKI